MASVETETHLELKFRVCCKGKYIYNIKAAKNKYVNLGIDMVSDNKTEKIVFLLNVFIAMITI